MLGYNITVQNDNVWLLAILYLGSLGEGIFESKTYESWSIIWGFWD